MLMAHLQLLELSKGMQHQGTVPLRHSPMVDTNNKVHHTKHQVLLLLVIKLQGMVLPHLNHQAQHIPKIARTNRPGMVKPRIASNRHTLVHNLLVMLTSKGQALHSMVPHKLATNKVVTKGIPVLVIHLQIRLLPLVMIQVMVPRLVGMVLQVVVKVATRVAMINSMVVDLTKEMVAMVVDIKTEVMVVVVVVVTVEVVVIVMATVVVVIVMAVVVVDMVAVERVVIVVTVAMVEVVTEEEVEVVTDLIILEATLEVTGLVVVVIWTKERVRKNIKRTLCLSREYHHMLVSNRSETCLAQLVSSRSTKRHKARKSGYIVHHKENQRVKLQ